MAASPILAVKLPSGFAKVSPLFSFLTLQFQYHILIKNVTNAFSGKAMVRNELKNDLFFSARDVADA
jgi:hypothetical protein